MAVDFFAHQRENCHSDPELAEGEESPHFARCAAVYTIGKIL
jgi:hypothetical protein